MEAQHQAQMNSLQDKREQLQSLLGHQTGALTNLKQNLQALSSNSSSLQQQQQQLVELVQRLVRIVAQDQRPGEQGGSMLGRGWRATEGREETLAMLLFHSWPQFPYLLNKDEITAQTTTAYTD